MKTGIILLNYNDSENTIALLNQIKDFSHLSTIVIVDNCSTDNSLEELKKLEQGKVVVLECKENKGYANGNNMGLKYLEENTKCELAIISNPDIQVEESVIEQLIEDMKQNPSISFLGPKILENGRIMKGWKQPKYYHDVLSTINFVQRIVPKMLRYPKEYYQEKLNKVDVLSGCFFLSRLKDFKKIKYFDPHTFLYYEENIIGKKAKEKQLITMVDTSVSVNHNCSVSVNKSLNKIKKYKLLKESMFYYEENYNHIGSIRKYFLKLIYYCSLAISYLTYWI